MTWQPDEWEAFCALLEEGWPGTFDDSTAEAWRVLLDSTPPQVAVEALRRLLLEGRRFRPSVSELLAATRDDPSQPTFDEAYWLIFGPRGALRARSTGVALHEGEQRQSENDAALERARTMHPLIASFMERQGLDRLRMLPLDDPDYGEIRRKELREAWERHCEATEGRVIAALASGSGELRQLDPLASLPQIESGS